MKILQVISHYLPAIKFGGPLQVAHGLGVALDDLGHTVSICTTNLASPSEWLDVSLEEPALIDDVHVYYADSRFLRYWGFSAQLARNILREARHSDVILIHFHYQFASVVGGWCARYLNKPYVIFTHGSLNENGISLKGSRYKRAYLKYLEKKNFDGALFTAYHSQVEREQSLSFESETIIVPIGVDPGIRTNGYEKKYEDLPISTPIQVFTFVYMGRVSEGKGLMLLLDALSELIGRGKNLKLVIIGADERGYMNLLKDQIESSGLDEYVVFTGLLDGAAKYETLSSADVFVLPSRSEGTSIVTLEAMAMGLPVLISDRVGLKNDVVEASAGLVVHYELGSLVAGLAQMIESSDLRGMGMRGKELVGRKYNWESIATDFVRTVEGRIES